MSNLFSETTLLMMQDVCYNGLNSYTISGKVFDRLFPKNVRDYNTVSNISSDPLRICPCKDNLPDCRRSLYRVLYLQVYPGEAFQVSVVAVGQRDGTVSSTMRSAVRTSITNFPPS